MSDGFYLADVKAPDTGQKIKTEKDVLHFKFAKAEFDDRAKPEHIKNFASYWGEFKAAHPGFKSPFGDEDDSELKLNPGESVGVPKTSPEEDKANSKKGKTEVKKAAKSAKAKKGKVTKGPHGVIDVAGKDPKDTAREHLNRDRPIR